MKMELEIGEIIQIKPDPNNVDDIFGGALMIVTEVKSWGAQGYVQVPGKGQAYYRATWDKMEPTGGYARYMIGDHDETT